MNDFDLKKYLAEGRLLKEDAKSELKDKVKDMSKEKFIELAKSAGDLEKFEMASKGKKDDGTPIDPFSNIDDRLEVIDQNFDEKDAEKYLAENRLLKEEEKKQTVIPSQLKKLISELDPNIDMQVLSMALAKIAQGKESALSLKENKILTQVFISLMKNKDVGLGQKFLAVFKQIK